MRLYKRFDYKLIFSTMLLMLTEGCSSLASIHGKSHPVSWSSGYQMIELLSEKVTVNTQKDLQKLIDAEWYAEIAVVGTKNSAEGIFSSCKKYLSEVTETTHTYRENETGTFLEFAIMCRATELLLNAKASLRSNIPDAFLNKSMPENFPTAIAFQTSTTEAEKNSKDNSKQYWGDINKNLQFELISKDHVKFFDNGGSQNILLVGRGDFNNDKLEDVLIVSRDSVEGGSYFNIRLFALSVNEKGVWVIVEEYKY